MTTNVVAYKMAQLKTQSEKHSLQEQVNALTRCKPGWRWEEEAESTIKALHIWIRVAEDVTSRDVELRMAAGPTNQLILRVKKEIVFDNSMRLWADVEGSDCEWAIEPDWVRNGSRSIHVSLPRCTHKPCVTFTNCFRGALPKALLTTKTFGESRPAAIPKKKKRRAPRVTETILSGCEAPPAPAAIVPLDMFYGVPVCDAEGKWSIITGPESSSASSSLIQAHVPKEAKVVDLPPASHADASTVESHHNSDTENETCKRSFDESSCEVLGVAPGGQAAQFGVRVGWRATAVLPSKEKLSSLQDIIGKVRAARRQNTTLHIQFEMAQKAHG